MIYKYENISQRENDLYIWQEIARPLPNGKESCSTVHDIYVDALDNKYIDAII